MRIESVVVNVLSTPEHTSKGGEVVRILHKLMFLTLKHTVEIVEKSVDNVVLTPQLTLKNGKVFRMLHTSMC